MIQLINYSGVKGSIDTRIIKVSKITSPKSLDEYNINIIDLSDSTILRQKGSEIRIVDCINNNLTSDELKLLIKNEKGLLNYSGI